MIGEIIGSYSITANLGGGMVEFDRATDSKLTRDVALPATRKRMARFQREPDVYCSSIGIKD
jgi:hypothetical protein